MFRVLQFLAVFVVSGFAGAMGAACVTARPNPGHCECVCAWPKPTEETGRYFRFHYSVDGGVELPGLQIGPPTWNHASEARNYIPCSTS